MKTQLSLNVASLESFTFSFFVYSRVNDSTSVLRFGIMGVRCGSVEVRKEIAWSLGLIIPRGQSVSGHVIQAKKMCLVRSSRIPHQVNWPRRPGKTPYGDYARKEIALSKGSGLNLGCEFLSFQETLSNKMPKRGRVLHHGFQTPRNRWKHEAVEVFGTRDDAQSPSFWHVFSNETIENYAVALFMVLHSFHELR